MKCFYLKLNHKDQGHFTRTRDKYTKHGTAQNVPPVKILVNLHGQQCNNYCVITQLRTEIINLGTN